MRRITIVSPAIMTGIVLYDGSRRREFKTLEELSDKVLDNLQGYKPGRQIEVYLKGFNGRKEEVEKYLSDKLPKAKYIVK